MAYPVAAMLGGPYGAVIGLAVGLAVGLGLAYAATAVTHSLIVILGHLIEDESKE